MSECTKCASALESDERALYKKLFGKTAETFMCISCCAEYLCVTEALLYEKIKQFKAAGCTLFDMPVDNDDAA